MRGLTIFCKWHPTESLCDERAIFVNEWPRRGCCQGEAVECFDYRWKSASIGRSSYWRIPLAGNVTWGSDEVKTKVLRACANFALSEAESYFIQLMVRRIDQPRFVMRLIS
jgi:hypothetical protein